MKRLSIQKIKALLIFLKSILNDEPLGFKLTEEQQNIVRENTENYLSGKDKGKSWDEIKSKLISKRNG